MEPLAVTLFNWNGKSFIKIITNVCCDCVQMKAQNTIYAIAINEEIISISVPEIDRNGAEKFEAGDFQIKGKTGKDDVCILLNDA